MRKIKYENLFTLRKDGRYMGFWHDRKGQRHAIYDRDAERLYRRIEEKETVTPTMFADVAEAWLAEHSAEVGYKTAESYAAPVRRLVAAFSDYRISEVTSAEIKAVLQRLAAQGYSRRSVQLHRDIVNMICNYAIFHGELSQNPCAAVKMPRNLTTTKRSMPSDDALEAVKASVDVDFSLFALTCLYTGLRRGEALALRYEDIDRENKLLRVNKAVEFIGNHPQIKPPKTEAGKRTVVIPDVLMKIFPSGHGYVFSDDGEQPLTKTQYRKRWQKYCKAIGHDITAHQLRHGYATLLYEAGVEAKDAQELLGHANISVTLDVYTDIRQSRRSATAKIINGYLT